MTINQSKGAKQMKFIMAKNTNTETTHQETADKAETTLNGPKK